jgi:hypothetical protein
MPHALRPGLGALCRGQLGPVPLRVRETIARGSWSGAAIRPSGRAPAPAGSAGIVGRAADAAIAALGQRLGNRA